MPTALLRDPEAVSTRPCLFQYSQSPQCARVSVHVCLTSVDAAVRNVNACLRRNDARRTVSALMAPELQLPQVCPFAAALYHDELKVLQGRAPQVRDTPEPNPNPNLAQWQQCPVALHQGAMQQEELFVAVEMLSEVALINQALEVGQLPQFGSLLTSPAAGLSEVEPTLLHR